MGQIDREKARQQCDRKADCSLHVCSSPEFNEDDPTASPPVITAGDGILIALITIHFLIEV